MLASNTGKSLLDDQNTALLANIRSRDHPAHRIPNLLGIGTDDAATARKPAEESGQYLVWCLAGEVGVVADLLVGDGCCAHGNTTDVDGWIADDNQAILMASQGNTQTSQARQEGVVTPGASSGRHVIQNDHVLAALHRIHG